MTPNKINLENDMNRREHPRKCGARIFNKDYDKILYINLPYIKINNPKASTSSALRVLFFATVAKGGAGHCVKIT